MVSTYGLSFETPVQLWNEALPLGNGLLGAMVWGDGHPLRISLDRTDLWDLRLIPEFSGEEYSYKVLRQWVAEGRAEDVHRVYESSYTAHAGPTNFPAGRIELQLADKAKFKSTSLAIDDPAAKMQFDDGAAVAVVVHATEPLGVITANSPDAIVDVKVITPPFTQTEAPPDEPRGTIGDVGSDLNQLGYPEAEVHSGDGFTGFSQECYDGFSYAVCLMSQADDAGWRAVWSIATNKEDADPFALARRRCRQALERGVENLLVSHRQWWKDYWAKSAIRIPNKLLERQWYLDTYKFGAAARRGAPAIPLQGPWTQDSFQLPAWKSAYHNDLNTPQCYSSYYSANHMEEGAGFLDWLWRIKPTAEKWTRRFFDKPGLNIPGVSTLEGMPVGGWHQYVHSCTIVAWLSQHFYLHWRYSMDRKFLKDRAYPFLKSVGVFLEAITEKGDDGMRTLPLSSSPEFNDNRLEAWFGTITNFDLSLIRWLFGAAAELAGELKLAEDAQHFKDLLAEMPQLFLSDDDQRLLLTRDFPLPESHRHFSHLMAVYPLGLFLWDKGPADQRTITAAVEELERLGPYHWAGLTYPWMACIAARAHDGCRAEKALETFAKAFCSRNSLHIDGDQSGSGTTRFVDKDFTLEANFAAAAATQEMLLQSCGEAVYIFPAVPNSWQDVSFESMRAEGAFLISAKRTAGQTQEVTIVAECGGRVSLADPFAGKSPKTQLAGAKEVSSDNGRLVFECDEGGRVELRL
ncbi:MAG: glycoside hydrolase N-terminal domain-containing protein [Planctomycetota bacterium]|nr:glycoside hydrolase N-terminal domain-containing protein [Planctomycetota bacterium]